MADSWLLPAIQRHSLETRVALVLKDMEELVRLGESGLRDMAASYRRLLEDPGEPSGPCDEEWLEDVASNYEYSVWKAEGLLPQYTRRAWFVSILAFAEGEMSLVCELCRPRAATDLSLRDLRQQGLRGVSVYAKKVLEIPFPDCSEAWSDLLFYWDIRNKLVHSGSRVAAEDSSLRQRIATHESLALDTHGVISLGDAACPETIAAARKVMLGFLETIPVSHKLVDGLGCFPPE